MFHFLRMCKIKKQILHISYCLFDKMIYEMLVSESQPVTLMSENASLGQRAQGETEKVGSIEAYPHKY